MSELTLVIKQQSISNETLLRLATYASVLTATILISVKLYAWTMTGSVSILASLVDSLMDVAASVVNLFAISHSLRPADNEHRFGHGKAESLAGLGQSVLIIISAAFLLLSAVARLRAPVEIESFSLGTGVIIFSIVLTLLLVTFQAYVIRRTDSSALKADALHYRADLITNVGILFALAGVYYGFVFMDPIFGILIALYIVYSAWGIAEDAVQTLLDRELPDEMRENILAVASAVAQVHSIHDLRTRRSGLTVFIQLHIELDETLTLKDAHEVADRVEFALRKAIPNADVIIHEDPISI